MCPLNLTSRYDIGRPGLRNQKGSRGTSQEGSWLHAGWKSDMSQKKVRAEFIEDTETGQIRTEPLEDPEGRVSLSFAWGLGFY